MYIIIFGLLLNILWRRRESLASKAYTRWIVALFVLTTIFTATTVWIQIDETLVAFNAVKTGDYIPLLKSISFRAAPSNTPHGYEHFWLASHMWRVNTEVILPTKGFECVFFGVYGVHCCYVIWGYNKWILYPFAFVVLVTDVTGFVATAVEISAFCHHNTASYLRTNSILSILTIISTVYTSLLTLLTAGRIWWMTRQVGQIAGSKIYTKYKIIVATVLESSFLYTVTQVVAVVLVSAVDPEHNGLIPFDCSVISAQMTATALTLIIVQIAHGQAVESVEQMVLTLQFAEGVNNSQQRSMAARGTVDIR
ncbi:hypothetical protein PM082_004469 [Marasmius tenuissimus]|nr:hypothetical protein PM082_004469 [Marasmius tenuissimus]